MTRYDRPRCPRCGQGSIIRMALNEPSEFSCGHLDFTADLRATQPMTLEEFEELGARFADACQGPNVWLPTPEAEPNSAEIERKVREEIAAQIEAADSDPNSEYERGLTEAARIARGER